MLIIELRVVVATRVATIIVMGFSLFVTLTVVASIAVITSIFVVGSFSPQSLFRCHSTVVASVSPPAIASTVAVSASRLVVVSVAAVVSRSIGAGGALIVAASAVRSPPVASPAFALAHLATSVARAARLALLAKIVCEHPLGAVAQPLDLVAFERAVDLALRKE